MLFFCLFVGGLSAVKVPIKIRDAHVTVEAIQLIYADNLDKIDSPEATAAAEATDVYKGLEDVQIISHHQDKAHVLGESEIHLCFLDMLHRVWQTESKLSKEAVTPKYLGEHFQDPENFQNLVDTAGFFAADGHNGKDCLVIVLPRCTYHDADTDNNLRTTSRSHGLFELFYKIQFGLQKACELDDPETIVGVLDFLSNMHLRSPKYLLPILGQRHPLVKVMVDSIKHALSDSIQQGAINVIHAQKILSEQMDSVAQCIRGAAQVRGWPCWEKPIFTHAPLKAGLEDLAKCFESVSDIFTNGPKWNAILPIPAAMALLEEIKAENQTADWNRIPSHYFQMVSVCQVQGRPHILFRQAEDRTWRFVQPPLDTSRTSAHAKFFLSYTEYEETGDGNPEKAGFVLQGIEFCWAAQEAYYLCTNAVASVGVDPNIVDAKDCAITAESIAALIKTLPWHAEPVLGRTRFEHSWNMMSRMAQDGVLNDNPYGIEYLAKPLPNKRLFIGEDVLEKSWRCGPFKNTENLSKAAKDDLDTHAADHAVHDIGNVKLYPDTLRNISPSDHDGMLTLPCKRWVLDTPEDGAVNAPTESAAAAAAASAHAIGHWEEGEVKITSRNLKYLFYNFYNTPNSLIDIFSAPSGAHQKPAARRRSKNA